MKSSLKQGPIVAVLIIAFLVAGTALVAGYGERPAENPQVAAQSECGACPLRGTEFCCKAEEGACCRTKACASGAEPSACGSQAGACLREKIPAASSEAAPCGTQEKAACGSGGCTLAR